MSFSRHCGLGIIARKLQLIGRFPQKAQIPSLQHLAVGSRQFPYDAALNELPVFRANIIPLKPLKIRDNVRNGNAEARYYRSDQADKPIQSLGFDTFAGKNFLGDSRLEVANAQRRQQSVDFIHAQRTPFAAITMQSVMNSASSQSCPRRDIPVSQSFDMHLVENVIYETGRLMVWVLRWRDLWHW